MYDYLIVGCGFAGSVLAERLATQQNKKVLMIERRNHIAGNAFDKEDEHNVHVHMYGPHIFHTNSHKVWNYLSKFTTWIPYEHRVLAVVDGKRVPVPFNFKSIDLLFGSAEASKFKELLVNFYGMGSNIPILKLLETNEPELQKLAKYIYDKVFYGYTVKQWGLSPKQLDPSVTSRVPVRVDYDDRYFQDTYQAIPRNGYSTLFKNMISHPNIEIRLNTDYKDILNKVKFERMIYTGPIDYFFDYKYGRLPYRSLNFEFSYFEQERFQETAQVNFPNDHPFTRITEFKNITNQIVKGTTIATEFPTEYIEGVNERYYPIPIQSTREIFNKYLADSRAFKGKVFFVGRLAEYKYFNMDQIVGRSLSLYETELTEL